VPGGAVAGLDFNTQKGQALAHYSSREAKAASSLSKASISAMM
jgi:hypothetical protein